MSTPAPARRIVIAAFDADPGEDLDRLVDLVRAVIVLGWEPDVVLVGDGLRLDVLRRLVPVTVVDEFRRRGLGFVPHVIGWTRAQRGLKRFGLQRWLRTRHGLPWIIADPRAAAMLRYGSPEAAGPLVGYLGGSTAGLDDLTPTDRSVLDAASAWLVTTEDQAAELAAAGLAPGTVLGALSPPDASMATEAGWPVLLVPTPGSWGEVNHTIETAARLVDRHPSIPIHWLVRSAEDEWLARFDLDHLGLADLVSVVWPDEAPVVRYRMLVRTGYGAAEADRCREAAGASIPVAGFELDDPDGTLPPVVPFDVDGLLDEIDRVLPDEDTIRVRQERFQDALDAHAATVAALGVVLDGLAPSD